jgi:alpha-N-arabinofuranosidase
MANGMPFFWDVVRIKEIIIIRAGKHFCCPLHGKTGFPSFCRKENLYLWWSITGPVARSELPDGNFVWEDRFGSKKLGYDWLFVRTPIDPWWRIEDDAMKIDAIQRRIYDIDNPAYIGRRIQHLDFEFSVEMDFVPQSKRN